MHVFNLHELNKSNKPKTMQLRLMLYFSVFTLMVCGIFGLSAMAFVYSVEDEFLIQFLQKEVSKQQQFYQQHGKWREMDNASISLHTDISSLPLDLKETIVKEPFRLEAAGKDGRHYHLAYLQTSGQAPWLVAEVSQQLIVRPMRDKLLSWLAFWGVLATIFSLLLSWWISKKTSAPLEHLATRVAQIDPQCLPSHFDVNNHTDEVGSVIQGFSNLLARIKNFIEREQDFTRDVSHELRTPLTVMKMAIERLQTQNNLSVEAGQQLQVMQDMSLQMEATIQTLLLLARENATTTKQATPILPIFEQWVVMNESWLDQQSLSLNSSLTMTDHLRLPPQVIQLVLSNLLGNAFSHGEKNGMINISMLNQVLIISNSIDVQHNQQSEVHGSSFGLNIMQRLLSRFQAHIELIKDNKNFIVKVVIHE